MDATEKIYQLVKQWSSDIDPQSTKALCEIALIAGCISPQEAIAVQVNETQYMSAIKWLQRNYPNAYLWAIGQRCIGHPAAIWGIAAPKAKFHSASCQSMPKNLNLSLLKLNIQNSW